MAYWWPLIEGHVRAPNTIMVPAPKGMVNLLDGQPIDGFDEFIRRLQGAAEAVGIYPVFLRTGHGSGKHEASRCCLVPDKQAMAKHVGALVEWSNLVDILGLPVDVWAVREMLPTEPLHVARSGLPIVPEARMFIRDGDVACVHPYWPMEALVQRWCGLEEEAAENLAAHIAVVVQNAEPMLREMAQPILERVPGAWSVDWMLTTRGWYHIDMGLAARSWHPPCNNWRQSDE